METTTVSQIVLSCFFRSQASVLNLKATAAICTRLKTQSIKRSAVSTAWFLKKDLSSVIYRHALKRLDAQLTPRAKGQRLHRRPGFPKWLSVGTPTKGSLTRMTGPLTDTLGGKREASAGGRIPRLLGAKGGGESNCEISRLPLNPAHRAGAHHAELLL